MFQVYVFVASVVNLQDSCAYITTSNRREDHIGTIKEKSRVACFSFDSNSHVALRNVSIDLVNEKLELTVILSWKFS